MRKEFDAASPPDGLDTKIKSGPIRFANRSEWLSMVRNRTHIGERQFP